MNKGHYQCVIANVPGGDFAAKNITPTFNGTKFVEVIELPPLVHTVDLPEDVHSAEITSLRAFKTASAFESEGSVTSMLASGPEAFEVEDDAPVLALAA